MRWTLGASTALLLLWLTYAVWPWYGLHQLTTAVQARDSGALSERVEYRLLRRSLTEQLNATYLQSAKSVETASGTTTTRADATELFVTAFLKPENLLNFLAEGAIPIRGAAHAHAPLSNQALSSGARVWISSKHTGRNFYLSLPPIPDPEQRVGIHLRLASKRWKLAGIDLPAPLRTRLVREFIEASP
jgi:hypothetical protein